ncbi:PAS domain-containing protein [Nigerium sp.]|jgi:PAS domain S-box-containing protein|uniref:PAS domain-containing protein n=1 Tax=Nigerium sp. TaxID=2042655 RepID=UPI003221D561
MTTQRSDEMRDLMARALADAGDAVIVIDRQGIIRVWNGKAVELFGWTPEQAIGQDVKIMIPEKLRDLHDHGFFSAMEAGHLHSDGHARRTKGLTASGEPVYVVMTFAVVYGDDGSAIGSVAVARPAPERRPTPA